MSCWTNHYNQPISPEEQLLYDHLLALSQVELPGQLVERFRKLFVEGVGYPDGSVQEAVEQIVSSTSASIEFKFVLNRCCHILINRWLVHPRFQGAVPDLIDVFQLTPSTPTYSRAAKVLREQVRLFTETEQYLTLRRFAAVVQREETATTVQQMQPLGSYIGRYPYLYEHCLLVEDSGSDQRHIVRRIRARVQRQFEIDLSRYITHHIVRSRPDYQRREVVKNPTLLSDRDLNFALKQFAGKVDGQNTQRDLAQQFLTYSRQAPSYRVFKDELYDYLRAAVDPEYGKHQFYDSLYTHLQQTLYQNDEQKPDNFLVLRTCSRLLNFLVVDSPQKPNHTVFLDLITNIGTTLAINLLLKIVLLSQKVKSHLEKRFSILFNHYEFCTKESGIGWLIEALETLNVAFATNFGSVHFLSI